MATDVSDSEEQAVELVRFLVTSILGEDVDLELETEQEPGEFRIDIHVPSEVRGRIIGRHGRAARSMRNILTAADLDLPGRVTLDIVD